MRMEIVFDENRCLEEGLNPARLYRLVDNFFEKYQVFPSDTGVYIGDSDQAYLGMNKACLVFGLNDRVRNCIKEWYFFSEGEERESGNVLASYQKFFGKGGICDRIKKNCH